MGHDRGPPNRDGYSTVTMKSASNLAKWAPLAALGPLLGGCSLSTPFSGPGVESSATDQQLIVGVTHATLPEDRDGRALFWAHVNKVEASLPQQPGFVGFAKRAQVFGNQAWTLTFWHDEPSLLAFVRSPAHQAAIRDSATVLAGARFARFTVSADELPIDWTRALQALEQQQAVSNQETTGGRY